MKDNLLRQFGSLTDAAEAKEDDERRVRFQRDIDVDVNRHCHAPVSLVEWD